MLKKKEDTPPSMHDVGLQGVPFMVAYHTWLIKGEMVTLWSTPEQREEREKT
jgi:hypothetical protein